MSTPKSKSRDRLEVLFEVLRLCSTDGILKTRIMQRANLSSAQLNNILSDLTRFNLICLDYDECDGNALKYYITQKGIDFQKTFSGAMGYLGLFFRG